MHTILLVDDQPALLKLLKALLDGAGFRVLATNSANQALRICNYTRIDLLVTEVSLLDLPGKQLALLVAAANPDVRTLYMSRADRNGASGLGLGRVEAGVLRKPFSPADLLNAVDAILESSGQPSTQVSSEPGRMVVEIRA